MSDLLGSAAGCLRSISRSQCSGITRQRHRRHGQLADVRRVRGRFASFVNRQVVLRAELPLLLAALRAALVLALVALTPIFRDFDHAVAEKFSIGRHVGEATRTALRNQTGIKRRYQLGRQQNDQFRLDVFVPHAAEECSDIRQLAEKGRLRSCGLLMP